MSERKTIIVCVTVILVAVIALVCVGMVLDKMTATVVQGILAPIILGASGAAIWKAHRSDPNGKPDNQE